MKEKRLSKALQTNAIHIYLLMFDIYEDKNSFKKKETASSHILLVMGDKIKFNQVRKRQ